MKRLTLLLFTAFLLAVPAVAGHAQRIDPADPMDGRLLPSAPAAVAASDSIVYATSVMNQNLIGMMLSNYCFIGTNFASSAPSLEYPLGSTHMHMVRGGLWVGAVAFDTTEFVGVSTGAIDGSKGSSGASSTEYTPGTNRMYARSTNKNSRVYDPNSVSELDFISLFSDMPAKTKSQTGSTLEGSRPLGIAVTQYNYEWSYSDYAHMCFFHYVIRNVSDLALTNVWVGLYNELASGSMKDVNFAPGGAWFGHKEIGWVDSLSLFTERYCEAYTHYPTDCHYFKTPEVIGLKLLGMRTDSLYRDSLGIVRDTLIEIKPRQVTMQAWSWSPSSKARDEDVEKYALMSAGTRTPLSPMPDSLKPVSGDPVELIATGPIPRLNPGDSVSVDLVYMGVNEATTQADMAQLVNRAQIAQRAYELNYHLPVPPPPPAMKIIARDHAVDFFWDDSTSESFLDPTGRNKDEQRDFEGYRIFLADHQLVRGERQPGSFTDYDNPIAQFDVVDSTGYNTGFSAIKLPTPVTFPGDTTHYTYKYTIDHLRDGFKYWAAITAYDRGTPLTPSMEGGLSPSNEFMVVPAPAPGERGSQGVTVFPNPYRVETKWDAGQLARDHYLWFANLPQQAKLKIYSLSGALIFETDFDGASYNGSNARGINPSNNQLSMLMPGTLFGWDMITREGQAAATGLYIWAVEDKHTGKHQTGKFLLVKSDREIY